MPLLPAKDNGEPRRVGFELEFTGISLDQAMSALRSVMDGELQIVSHFEQKLKLDSGTFVLELDWEFLKRKGQEQENDGDWIDLLGQAVYSSQLIPLELVCPPLPIHDIAQLQPVVKALRKAGALGTSDSPIAAFGVHINVEPPNLQAGTLLRYLQAFALLQWWLMETLRVDLSRKISPFVDPYPADYVKLLLDYDRVTIDQIIDDYVEHNPSRNRALDMLPMLVHIDRERVLARISESKIKSRPAFHYRLPNSQIDRKDWSLASAWNSWWLVEQLASRPALLDQLIREYLLAFRPIIGISRKTWVEFIDTWLTDQQWG
ncbi:MAG: amidoligase family protein [Gammaproteobacteria bacterium]|nr:amidoligase family protein [Gammaproteobacteria bacterium]